MATDNPLPERPDVTLQPQPTPTPAPIQSAFRLAVLSHGIVPWLFLVSGIYLAILAAAAQAGVASETMVSWFASTSVAGGLATIILSTYYRQPVILGVTTHGGLLAAAALGHISIAEANAAYLLTAVLVAVLAGTGLASKLIDRLPLPIMLGMVVGIIFQFAIGAAQAAQQSPLVVGLAILAYLVSLRWLSHWGVPASLWAAAVGMAVASLTGAARWGEFTPQMATLVFTWPHFTLRAVLELTLPLTVLVIAVHGTQSAGIMRGAGYPYHTRAFNLTAGVGSMPVAFMGGPPLGLLGPPLAMLVSGVCDGQDKQRWAAAVVLGALLVLLGVFSPVLTSVPRVLPAPLTAAVAGLAILEVLQGYLARAFTGSFRFGALVAFVVTASKVSFLGVGSPFWGVVAGLVVSALLEAEHFRTQGKAASPPANPAAT